MLNALMDGLTVIADFLGQPWRPYELPVDEPYATGFPSYAVGTRRSALYEEVINCMLAQEPQRSHNPQNTLLETPNPKMPHRHAAAYAWQLHKWAVVYWRSVRHCTVLQQQAYA